MSIEKEWKIYLITNSVNGKIYIGQTSGKLNTRLREHFSAAFNQNQKQSYKMIVCQAIRKHGKENFTISLLEDGIKTINVANDKEVECIAKYNSQNSEIGYNKSNGGLNYTRTEETKEKIKEARKKQPAPMLGKKHSEEAKKLMSLTKSGKKKSPMSEVTKSKISAANTGKKTTPEAGAKIAAANRSRIVSDETRKRQSVAQLNSVKRLKNKELFEDSKFLDFFVSRKIEILVPKFIKPKKEISQDSINKGILTNVQNGRKEKTSSKYIGVFKDGKYEDGNDRFRAVIRINKKLTYLGCFTSEIEAAKVRDTEAQKLGRPLNFPLTIEKDMCL